MHANFGVGLKRISMPDFTGKFIHLLYHHLKQLIINTQASIKDSLFQTESYKIANKVKRKKLKNSKS